MTTSTNITRAGVNGPLALRGRTAACWGVVALLALAGAAQGQSGPGGFGRSEMGSNARGGRSAPARGGSAFASAGFREPVIDLNRQARLRRSGQVLPGDTLPSLASGSVREALLRDEPVDWGRDGGAPGARETAERFPAELPGDAGRYGERNAVIDVSPGTLPGGVESADDVGSGMGMMEAPVAPSAPAMHDDYGASMGGDDWSTAGRVDDASTAESAEWGARVAADDPFVPVRRVSDSVTVVDLGVDGVPMAFAAEGYGFEDRQRETPRERGGERSNDEADRQRVVANREVSAEEVLAVIEEMRREEEAERLAMAERDARVIEVAPVADAMPVEPVATTTNAPTAVLDERTLVARPEAYQQSEPRREGQGMKDPVVSLDDSPRVSPARPTTSTTTTPPPAPRPAVTTLDPSRPGATGAPGAPTTAQPSGVREPVVALDGQSAGRPTTTASRFPTGAPRPGTTGMRPVVDPAFPVGPVRESVIDLAGPNDQPLSVLDRAVEMYEREPVMSGEDWTRVDEARTMPAPGQSPAAAVTQPRLSVVLVEGSISNVQWRSLSAHGQAMETDWTTPMIGEERTGAIEVRTGVGTAVRVRLDEWSIAEIDRMSRVTIRPGAAAEGFGASPARVELNRGRVHLRAAEMGRAPSATIVTPDQVFEMQSAGTIDYSAFVGSRRMMGE